MSKRRKFAFDVGLLALVGIAAYLLRPQPIYDYMAGADGCVVGPDGAPVANVRVRFKSADLVYEAISPLRSAVMATDSEGRFAFIFISCGKPAGPYRLTFEKDGFTTAYVVGKGFGRHRVVIQPANKQAAG